MKAIEYGAVEIIQKPRVGTKRFLEESTVRICDAVKAAAMARMTRILPTTPRVVPKLSADVILSKPTSKAMVKTTEKVVVVGASTGGTEALREFLEAMPLDAPGIVVVQHMPEHFTRAFAARLDGICRISVKEAENDDTIPGAGPSLRRAIIMLLKRRARYYVEIMDGPLVRVIVHRSMYCSAPQLDMREKLHQGHHDRHGRRRSKRHARNERGRGIYRCAG
jgi:two-component system chemotaxis response regulator CheB